MNSGDRLVGCPSRQCVQQFHQGHGGFAIWLDPFGMFDPQVVVNLLTKLGVGVDLVRGGRCRGQRFTVSAGLAWSMSMLRSKTNEFHNAFAFEV